MNKTEVTFKYVFDKDYDPEYVNGIYGGQNMSGELIINFYMERFPIPYEEKQVFYEDDTIESIPEITKPEDFKVRRVVKQGVILNKDTAISIFQWLKERLEEMGVDENEV